MGVVKNRRLASEFESELPVAPNTYEARARQQALKIPTDKK